MDVSVLLSPYIAGPPSQLSQQRRIYDALRNAILDGRIASGSRLPATRVLAEELRVARNSVLYAYERLVDEGFIAADRRGSVVAPLHLPGPARADAVSVHPASALARRVDGLRRRRSPRTSAGEGGGVQASFMPGTPALDAFPLAQWRASMERAWRRVGAGDLGYGDSGGQSRLRRAIADYLRVSRGVRCTAEQVFVTDGTQASLGWCATLLADPGDTAWIENPGYGGARAAFQTAALRLVPMPVDEHGIVARDGDWQRAPPKLIYLTPSHQYPLGSVLSIERRLGLIDAARAHRAWIIEDDYDSEFRHEGLPLPAVQGLRDDAPVIYVGTFSKTLFPALRLGFMVVPSGLMLAFSETLADVARQGRVADQLALADFIESGAYSRHLRRMRRLYSARRDALRDSLVRHLGRRLDISGGSGGMHLSVRFTVAVSDIAICAAARAEGLALAPLSDYGMRAEKHQALGGPVVGRADDGHGATQPLSSMRHGGLVLGYAGMPVDEVDRHVRTLARVIDDAIRQARITVPDETANAMVGKVDAPAKAVVSAEASVKDDAWTL